MTDEIKVTDHNWADDFKELIHGGWIMLFIFGGTICLLAVTSLVAALCTKDPAKIAMLSKLFDTILGFLAGAYTTMWNNQHFKEQKQTTNGKEKVEVTSNLPAGLQIQEVTLKKDQQQPTPTPPTQPGG